MERAQLEHLIRAASAILGEREWVVVGSQSVLGQYPNADPYFLQSMEADLYARFNPKNSDRIEGAIGEESSFHVMFGYYAQGVGPETSVLPKGWEGRLTLIENENTFGAKAYCIDVHDMACAKLVANREKDREFVRALYRHGMVKPAVMATRVSMLPIEPETRALIQQKIVAYADLSGAAMDSCVRSTRHGSGRD